MARGEMERETVAACRSAKTMWEAIAARLQERGYRRTAEQCKCNWKNLVNCYKLQKTLYFVSARMSGNRSIIYFFNQEGIKNWKFHVRFRLTLLLGWSGGGSIFKLWERNFCDEDLAIFCDGGRLGIEGVNGDACGFDQFNLGKRYCFLS
ncbi:hypothetical protein ZEAMMB73_Zm00001d024388 [Zea mays]|uniref:Myb/SANT-like DNA-binding domain-containing protein n=1 Tax=Zea mays TaxID=4577 RepID=A0A1D6IZ04_MAIZE|nr:hypothetical protein ZEAMMB73_Zm00001d024388 [Zea mays]